jgi:hypothetical protein
MFKAKTLALTCGFYPAFLTGLGVGLMLAVGADPWLFPAGGAKRPCIILRGLRQLKLKLLGSPQL